MSIGAVRRDRLAGCTAALMVMLASAVQPLGAAEPARHLLDIAYAQAGGHVLALDLHLPVGVRAAPLVVYLHGGAWRGGSKSEYPEFLTDHGYAVASVEFRSSTVARFPANVHDIKAAIRFLRAQAGRYGYDTTRIAVAGSSSGAHLAALIGTTNGLQALEGTGGSNLQESSAVQAIISWFGASNLHSILAQSTPSGRAMREPALQLLLGALPEKAAGLATLASPVEHVDAGDPPALLLHGDRDPQMPPEQTRELEATYRRAGRDVESLYLRAAGHGGDEFYTGEAARRVITFLRRTIGP